MISTFQREMWFSIGPTINIQMLNTNNKIHTTFYLSIVYTN